MKSGKSVVLAISVLASVVAIILLPESVGAVPQFVSIDYPGAMTTEVYKIANNGDAIGTYIDSEFRFHGFRWSEGQLTSIDIPDAIGTSAFGINDRGDIVGAYGAGNRNHGFVLSGSSVTTLDVPNARHTLAYAINSRGEVFGAYVDQDGAFQGFIYDRGSFRTISIPGAFNTFVYGGNARGDFAGSYIGPNGPHSFTSYGFVGSGDSITTINLGALTEVSDISDNGIIVGDYVDDPFSSAVHGFIMTSDGVVVHDFPGAFRTFVKGINNDGWAVGIYVDSQNHRHGFISTP